MRGMSQARIDNKGHAPCYQFLNSSFILQYRNREKNKKRTRKSFTKGREDGNINGHSTRETSERTLKTEQERIKHNVN